MEGEGGGSVCDLINCGGTDSSSSAAVKDCFSFEGDVMGECPFLPGEECGGVDGLPTTVLGVEGDEGRRKGDARGELNDSGDGLYVDACSLHSSKEGRSAWLGSIPSLGLSLFVVPL